MKLINCGNIPILLLPCIILLLLFSPLKNHFDLFTSFHGKVSDSTLETRTTTTPINYTITSINIMRNEHMNKLEQGLVKSRDMIRRAARDRTCYSYKEETFIPRGPVYRNPYAFHQSHIEMEKKFKIWTYKEGEAPLFHNGPQKGIYASEGQFIAEVASQGFPFRAHHPDEALAFFVPVSITTARKLLYRQTGDYKHDPLKNFVVDYVMMIKDKYPYWNRSDGGDHFMVSCHDWAPGITANYPELYKNFIRVLCNANTTEGFKPERDATLPEINVGPKGFSQPVTDQARKNRSVLAFFAGGEHGHVRKTLFEHWKEKDDEVQVYEYLPKTKNYSELMGRAKYCLCPSGYEVASPRVVESIYAGCVPVLISDNYVPPFSEVLDWSKFSVHVPVSKIPEIKEILRGIPIEKYRRMQRRVMQVQRHFALHRPAQPFDFLYMVLHSVWLRRLNVGLRN